MVVLGAGIGAIMQVLVISVRNAVNYADLGAGTSGATFFRSVGGSFGSAVFGAMFGNVLPGNIATALSGLRLPPGVSITSVASPAGHPADTPFREWFFVPAMALRARGRPE